MKPKNNNFRKTIKPIDAFFFIKEVINGETTTANVCYK
jgi:hypothetical protein